MVLRLHKISIQEWTKKSGLVPANMEVVDIDITKFTHHFYLVLYWKKENPIR